ncbi:MAG TPA: glycosyltransferase family 2 protein [candidate division Zixibacteria bacterium]|nr:glycosyltransferase family 2 protein [candidate division Zixibacteria bacterium]
MTEIESKYDLAVVMPVRNEEKFLGQTLDQLYLQDFPMDRLEVVISEGGSTDRTREIAESYKSRFGSLKILDNPRRLPSSGRNVGVKNSTAPFIVVIDGHTYIPNKSFLKDILEIFKRTGAQCLCRPQPLNPPDINEFQTAVALCRSSSLGHKPGSEIYSDAEGEVDPTSSGAMYVRPVFDQIGYFDESFDACEDVDFNYRVKLAGLSSFLSPKLKVYYYPRATIRGLWRQMGRYGKGRFKFSRKYKIFSPVQWFAAMGVLGFGLMLVLSFVFAPIFQVFKTVTALYILVVLVYSFALALREKQLACLLYGPLIFPTVHFGLGFGFLKEMIEQFKRK